MKSAIISTEKIIQIVLTPETKQDKIVLSLLTPNVNMDLLIKESSIGPEAIEPFTANIDLCRGGYLRIFKDAESKIIVLTPKESTIKDQNMLQPILVLTLAIMLIEIDIWIEKIYQQKMVQNLLLIVLFMHWSPIFIMLINEDIRTVPNIYDTLFQS